MCLDPAKGKYGVRESWEKAIHAEGAGQMQVLRKVCEAIGWQEGQSAQERLIQGGGEKYAHIPVFAGDDFVLAYDYSGEVFVLDVDSLSPFNAWLINPESGAKSCFAMDTAASFLQCSPPKRKGSTDWAVLVRKCRHKEGESHVKICDQKS